jgi:hypothetical protein
MATIQRAVNNSPTQRPENHRDNAPDPRENAGAVEVGVGAFSGGLRGLELVPSKWRYLVPPALTSVLRDPHHPHQGASRGC